MIKLTEATPVLVPTKESEGFALDVDAIEKALTPNTRVVLINTPNNPTGAVYSEESLRRLAALAVERDFVILSDEIYEKLIYGGAKHFSVASISEEVKKHTVIINGVSKAYAKMCIRDRIQGRRPESGELVWATAHLGYALPEGGRFTLTYSYDCNTDYGTQPEYVLSSAYDRSELYTTQDGCQALVQAYDGQVWASAACGGRMISIYTIGLTLEQVEEILEELKLSALLFALSLIHISSGRRPPEAPGRPPRPGGNPPAGR